MPNDIEFNHILESYTNTWFLKKNTAGVDQSFTVSVASLMKVQKDVKEPLSGLP